MRLLPSLAACLVLAGPVARGAQVPAKIAESEGGKRFAEVVEAYRKLPSYADRGVFTVSVTIRGKAHDAAMQKAHLRFARPDLVALDAGEVKLVGDGKTLTTALIPTRKYLETAAPRPLTADAIADGPMGALLRGGAAGEPVLLVLRLLIQGEGQDLLPDGTTGIAVEADAVRGGKTHRVLAIEQGPEKRLRLLIDPDSSLIRRIESATAGSSLGDRVPGDEKIESIAMAWDAGQIKTSNPPADAFVFKAPEGFTKVKGAEPAAAAAGGGEAGHELVGKPAPDFTLTVLDGAGKTRKVTKADLAGKVVLLDFWATWCPPCRAELPELQKVVAAYAKGKKGVVIVAVSQDREPEEGGPVRKLVEQTLDELKVDLNQGDVGRIALDPGQELGDTFKIEGLPTLFLLDAKGVVQAVHVGYREGVGETLTEEIDRLLSGESLIAPKPGAKPAAEKSK